MFENFLDHVGLITFYDKRDDLHLTAACLPCSAGQIREVIERPYRIIYHITPDQIDVIAVLHGARNVLRTEEEEN